MDYESKCCLERAGNLGRWAASRPCRSNLRPGLRDSLPCRRSNNSDACKALLKDKSLSSISNERGVSNSRRLRWTAWLARKAVVSLARAEYPGAHNDQATAMVLFADKGPNGHGSLRRRQGRARRRPSDPAKRVCPTNNQGAPLEAESHGNMWRAWPSRFGLPWTWRIQDSQTLRVPGRQCSLSRCSRRHCPRPRLLGTGYSAQDAAHAAPTLVQLQTPTDLRLSSADGTAHSVSLARVRPELSNAPNALALRFGFACGDQLRSA